MLFNTALRTLVSAFLITSQYLGSEAHPSSHHTHHHASPHYNTSPRHEQEAGKKSEDGLTERWPTGYRNAAYFVNWYVLNVFYYLAHYLSLVRAIYGRNYQPQQLPTSLTHLLYAFANLQSDGTVYLSDTYADTDKHYSTDSWNDVGTNVYGCVKQLYILKKHNRHMKTLLSIGGWTYSTNFAAAASTADNRARFASTAVQFVQDLGFDGIDIDWEYPANATQAANMVLLLQACRSALDSYALKYAPGSRLLLTVASPAGPSKYNIMQLKSMDAYLDAWHLMAYDYAGSWDTDAGHQANLYPNPANTNSTPFSTDRAVRDYIKAGVPSQKIVMGIPIYGRSFESTSGLGQPFSGIGNGSWEAGVWDYKSLPRPGATVYTDSLAGATYSYDESTKEMISFDTPAEVVTKARYIQNNRLGGGMFWETSADKTGADSLISTLVSTLGVLDQSLNCLNYSGSKYANLVAGMPNE